MTDVPLPQPGTHLPDPPSARIYLDFFRLAQAPFSITPDPGFLYHTRCHQQVFDKITSAIESRMGFTLLTGEVGTGTPMGKLIFFNRAGVFFGMRVKF